MAHNNVELEVSKCFESPTNPRGLLFDKAELAELVASIKQSGVIQPVLARPRKVGKFDYEVVCGNRRLRAAKEAGLTFIPALVKDLNDIEAREAQIVENLQRSDIHPLEEGEAYRKLIEEGEYDVAAVAAKVGKSETFVRDRLVLTGLIKKGQKAFRDGLITAGHAALVARLDEKMQGEVLKDELDIDSNPKWREVLTTADLRDAIQRRVFTASMSSPPWANDDEMKATLGGCAECSGKGGDLFGKNAADACTNPKCYAERMRAYLDIQLQKNPDLVRLTGNYSNTGDLIGYGSYKPAGGKNKCEHREKGLVMEAEGIGKVLDICRAPDCAKHWPTSKPGGHYNPTADEKEARAKEAKKLKAKKEQEAIDFQAAVKKLKLPLSQKHIDLLFDFALYHCGGSFQQPVVRLLGIEVVKRQEKYSEKPKMVADYEATLRKYGKENGNTGKMHVVFGLLMATPGPYNNDFPKHLKMY